MIPTKNLPTPSIRRLPGYLRLLKAARARGERVTSCTRIAEELGQQSVQVRKDLSVTGVSGRPKVGYSIDELIDAIQDFLGWNRKTNAFLVGAGNLGSAIINYEGFAEHGLKFSSAAVIKSVSQDLKDLDLGTYDVIVLHNSADVKALQDNFPGFTQGDLKFISYGRSIVKAMEEAGLKSVIQAPTPNVPSVAAAIEEYLKNQ